MPAAVHHISVACSANSRGVYFPVLLSVVLRVCQDVGDNTEEVVQQHTYLKQPDACSCKCRVQTSRRTGTDCGAQHSNPQELVSFAYKI